MAPFTLANTIIVILINLTSIWLGFWVYLANRKAKANKIFLVMSLLVVLWISSAYLCNFLTQGSSAHLWAKIGYGAGSLFLLFIYLFSNFFPKEEKKFSILNKFAITICLFLFFISIFTNFVVKDVTLTQWGTLPVLGNGQIVFLGLILLLGLFFVFQFFMKYSKLTKEEQLKIQYLLIGLFIFVIMNLIFNIILPSWQGIPRYYFVGNYSAIFFLGFTAFAIVKRELFGIKVVLTELLVGVIAILLLVNLIGSETLFEYIWKAGLFALFLVFGYLLIRSVLQEIKYRQELQKAYQELQKLDRAKSEFISIASHQLRTPLTAIKGYISMILEGTYGKIAEKAKGPIGNVYKSSERLIKLVNDLLSVSRIESGKLEVNLEKASLEEVILTVIGELEQEAKNKNIYLKWEKPKKPLPKILIDKDKIRQSILNLVDNAIHYTDQGGITIKTQIIDNKYQIKIKDTGEGMTKEETSHLFESFSRGKAGIKLWTEGAGLGLYVARKFVEMHNGKIWAKSEGKGKGSTFYIELPITKITDEQIKKLFKNL